VEEDKVVWSTRSGGKEGQHDKHGLGVPL